MAYKVFTNGSPLPASDLNTYLMNQSVMVFANSTARSAALTSPTEGMVTYLEDTNKVEVYTGSPLAWTDINDNSNAILKSTVTATGDLIIGNGNASVTRLGIGTNGQVLSSNGTTATWTTPSSGGGKVLLASGSLAGSTANYINSISQSYKDLELHILNVETTAGGDMYVYPRNGGSNLTLGRGGRSFTGSNWNDFSTANTAFAYVPSMGQTVAQQGSFTLKIDNYSQSIQKTYHYYGSQQGSNNRQIIGFGTIFSTSAVTALFIENDTTVSAGNYRLYGVN